MLVLLIIVLIGASLIRRSFYRPFGGWGYGLFGPRMWGGWGHRPMGPPPGGMHMNDHMHGHGGFGGPGMGGHGPGPGGPGRRF